MNWFQRSKIRVWVRVGCTIMDSLVDMVDDQDQKKKLKSIKNAVCSVLELV